MVSKVGFNIADFFFSARLLQFKQISQLQEMLKVEIRMQFCLLEYEQGIITIRFPLWDENLRERLWYKSVLEM